MDFMDANIIINDQSPQVEENNLTIKGLTLKIEKNSKHVSAQRQKSNKVLITGQSSDTVHMDIPQMKEGSGSSGSKTGNTPSQIQQNLVINDGFEGAVLMKESFDKPDSSD